VFKFFTSIFQTFFFQRTKGTETKHYDYSTGVVFYYPSIIFELIMKISFYSLFIVLITSLKSNNAFPTKTASKSRNIKRKPFIANPYANTIQMQGTATQDVPSSTEEKTPSDMKIKEIKAELRTLDVSFEDCFERDSLVKRLIDARENKRSTVDTGKGNISCKSLNNDPPQKSSKFDRKAVHQELRALRVAELRTQLAARGIRWGGMIEKEDLVQALLNAMEEAANFSSSGALKPGSVGDVTDDELRKERDEPATSAPLLLDIYATWCGPCKFLQTQMDVAATELGSKVRMAKLDSDKYPALAGSMRAEGLPTLILFDTKGKEIARKEGALMKDDLIRWIEQVAL